MARGAGGGGWARLTFSQNVREGVSGLRSCCRVWVKIVGRIKSQFKHNDPSFTYFVDKMFFTESEENTTIVFSPVVKTAAADARVQSNVIHSGQRWKQPKCPPADERINGR